MSEAKKLTAEEEDEERQWIMESGVRVLFNPEARRLFATLDAERAKVEALRDEKAAVEWMLEQDRAALAAAVTRATAAEAEAERMGAIAAKMVEGLRPFARMADATVDVCEQYTMDCDQVALQFGFTKVTVGQLRDLAALLIEARTALAKKEKPDAAQ